MHHAAQFTLETPTAEMKEAMRTARAGKRIAVQKARTESESEGSDEEVDDDDDAAGMDDFQSTPHSIKLQPATLLRAASA